MATEGDPTDLVKVLHLLVISFTWGMQVWVSFIAGNTYILYSCLIFLKIIHNDLFILSSSGFVLISQVSMHTFGLVQSKLFPFYFYCLLGGNAVNLAVYAVYHPRELLDWHEGIQVKSQNTFCIINTILLKTFIVAMLWVGHAKLISGKTHCFPLSHLSCSIKTDDSVFCGRDHGRSERAVVRPVCHREHAGHERDRAGTRAGGRSGHGLQQRRIRQAPRARSKIQGTQNHFLSLPWSVQPL